MDINFQGTNMIAVMSLFYASLLIMSLNVLHVGVRSLIFFISVSFPLHVTDV